MIGSVMTEPLGDFRGAFDGLRSLGRGAAFGSAFAATVLSEIPDQAVHHGEVSRVKELSAFPALGNESRPLKIL